MKGYFPSIYLKYSEQKLLIRYLISRAINDIFTELTVCLINCLSNYID